MNTRGTSFANTRGAAPLMLEVRGTPKRSSGCAYLMIQCSNFRVIYLLGWDPIRKLKLFEYTTLQSLMHGSKVICRINSSYTGLISNMFLAGTIWDLQHWVSKYDPASCTIVSRSSSIFSDVSVSWIIPGERSYLEVFFLQCTVEHNLPRYFNTLLYSFHTHIHNVIDCIGVVFLEEQIMISDASFFHGLISSLIRAL